MAHDTELKKNDQLASRPTPDIREDPVNETIQRATDTLDELDALQQELERDEGRILSKDETCFELPSDFVLSIVVPIYNERRTINRVIASLFALPIPVEVIAVDDGSTDGTCALLTHLNHEYPNLKVVFQETNQGKGAALRRGFSLATGSHVMVQDADLEYDPRDIPSLIEPLAKGEADAVYGSRFLEERWEGSSIVHRLGNRLLTEASNRMTGWRLTDMETCYKVFRRELLEKIELEQNGFGFEVELTAKLAKQDARGGAGEGDEELEIVSARRAEASSASRRKVSSCARRRAAHSATSLMGRGRRATSTETTTLSSS